MTSTVISYQQAPTVAVPVVHHHRVVRTGPGYSTLANFSRKALQVAGAVILGILSAFFLTSAISTFSLWQHSNFNTPIIVSIVLLFLGVATLTGSILCCRKSCRNYDNPGQVFSNTSTTPATATTTSQPAMSLPTHLVSGAPAGYQMVPSSQPCGFVQPSGTTYSYSPGIQVTGYAVATQDPGKVYSPGGPVAGQYPPGQIPGQYPPQQPTYPPTSQPASYPAPAPYTPYPAPPPTAPNAPYAPPPGAPNAPYAPPPENPEYMAPPPYAPGAEPPPYTK